MSCLFGMLLEGLPAAVVLIPVVFPIAEAMGIDPIHFNIVQTAAVGIGLFLPPMGVGLLMALRFANLSVGQHFRTYVPYMLALFAGLLLIICIPEISRSEEHTSELQSRQYLVCRLLLEKKKTSRNSVHFDPVAAMSISQLSTHA